MISDKTLRTLEFPKVLERLAAHTSFSLAREAALALRPATDLATVQELQQETAECVRLLDLGADVAMGGARDIRAAVARAELGGPLDPAQLLDVHSTLECAERVTRVLARLDEEQFPWLIAQRYRMGHFRHIVNAIAGAINDRGEVMDSASPALQRIRTELRIAHNRLIERLNSMLSATQYRNAVQDALITTRNGRYVIPIKTEFKGQIKGIVHDQSSSGATLFVEPLAVTELNNQWHQLQLDERDEIDRILREISALIGKDAAGIRSTIDALGAVDLGLAKARYGAQLKATGPALNDEGRIVLLRARHPLLTGHVVPIDVTLGDEFQILLITGPNTGGKTVALKTVGLLTLMAQSGLLVPADPGTQMAVFGAVFADIGDEQSIEQSLSTFSSHLTNIISMLENLQDNALLLLDELGAGTDPTEGSALARAILSYLLERDVRVIATTHYSELKAFAYNEPGVENASVEFDVETLSPTYRLSIGLPGRSNALAIARRLGLNPEIVERASSYLTGEERRVETMLAEIQQEREATAELYARADEAHRRAAEIRDRLQHELERLLGEREGIIAAARAEAEESVRALRGQLDRIEAELRTSTLTPQVGLAALRERLDQAVAAAPAILREQPRRERAVKPATKPAPVRELSVGDTVEVMRLGQRGTIISAEPGRDEVEVQVGALRMRVKRSDLRLVQAAPEERAPVQAGVRVSRPATPAPSMEVDMRGWRADEVAPELERYLHDAYMANLPFVRIIHGKGTGTLRQVVRDELATNPFVSGFHTAPPQEGGDGVTVVELSKS